MAQSVPETALAWHRAGRGTVIATVVQTWSSAPDPAGSQIVVAADGVFEGRLAGGSIEAHVVGEAVATLADGKPRLLTLDVPDQTAFAAGLACGGGILVLLMPVGQGLSESLLAELVTARAARRPVALVTDLGTWEQRLTDGAGDALEEAIRVRLRSDRSGIEAGQSFVEVHNPPLRLIVVGAVQIAQALLPMARACGYQPVLIDPRQGYATAERFSGETIIAVEPQWAMMDQVLDSRTAVVTLSHEASLDDPAIRLGLQSGAFYIGSLGSTRTHAKRVERLLAEGFSDAEIARIHGPVGLNIGSKSPPEIAVSILAEMTQVLRQG